MMKNMSTEICSNVVFDSDAMDYMFVSTVINIEIKYSSVGPDLKYDASIE